MTLCFPVSDHRPAASSACQAAGLCLLVPHAHDDRYHKHFHEPVTGMNRGHLPRDVLPEDRSREKDHRRSEEHTSELQSLAYLVCRLLLEKKKEVKKRSRSGGDRHISRQAIQT